MLAVDNESIPHWPTQGNSPILNLAVDKSSRHTQADDSILNLVVGNQNHPGLHRQVTLN